MYSFFNQLYEYPDPIWVLIHDTRGCRSWFFSGFCSFFAEFAKVTADEGTIRIRIKVISRIRILIKVISWIRFRIRVKVIFLSIFSRFWAFIWKLRSGFRSGVASKWKEGSGSASKRQTGSGFVPIKLMRIRYTGSKVNLIYSTSGNSNSAGISATWQ